MYNIRQTNIIKLGITNPTCYNTPYDVSNQLSEVIEKKDYQEFSHTQWSAKTHLACRSTVENRLPNVRVQEGTEEEEKKLKTYSAPSTLTKTALIENPSRTLVRREQKNSQRSSGF
jgi:hypothetical protein